MSSKVEGGALAFKSQMEQISHTLRPHLRLLLGRPEPRHGGRCGESVLQHDERRDVCLSRHPHEQDAKYSMEKEWTGMVFSAPRRLQGMLDRNPCDFGALVGHKGIWIFVADNLRLCRADPNALPAVTERHRPPELHVHLHQLRRVVRRAVEELPEEHHVPRGQRGGVFVSAKQTQRSARRLQGTQTIYRDNQNVCPRLRKIPMRPEARSHNLRRSTQ